MFDFISTWYEIAGGFTRQNVTENEVAPDDDGRDCGAPAASKDTQVIKFYSHDVALPPKMNFHDSAFIPRSRAEPGEIEQWQLLCDGSLLH